MRTRRSPRNQEILWRALCPPKPPTPPAEPLDLETAWWLSPRAKEMIVADRARAARRAIIATIRQRSNGR